MRRVVESESPESQVLKRSQSRFLDFVDLESELLFGFDKVGVAISRSSFFRFGGLGSRSLESSPFFSSRGEIYRLVHVGRQPECEICLKKRA